MEGCRPSTKLRANLEHDPVILTVLLLEPVRTRRLFFLQLISGVLIFGIELQRFAVVLDG